MIRLGHVCLGTTRLEEMVAFYCELLGCRIAHEFVNDSGSRYGVFLSAGEGTFLELFHQEQDPGNTGRLRHIAFQVEDIRSVAKQFVILGQAPEVRRGRTDGALQCWITDPDGNEVEFHEYDAHSVQQEYMPENRS